MAKNSGARASSLLRLSDRFSEVIAFEFDLACASRLKVYDEEKQVRMFEALGMGSLTRALAGPQTPNQQSGATVIEAGWQVPDAQV